MNSDYQKEYELMRDHVVKETVQATEAQLSKIQKQGPGNVVQLGGLVSEVSFICSFFYIIFLLILFLNIT